MPTPDDADLYADLGVTRAASRAEITRAYRALLRAHHPDTRPHPGTESASHGSTPVDSTGSSSTSASDQILERVLAAYAVLADPDRRATYDHQQRNHHPGGGQRTPPPATAGPTPPMKPAGGPFWLARGVPIGPPGESPPPIRVGPVRWHRITPTTRLRP